MAGGPTNQVTCGGGESRRTLVHVTPHYNACATSVAIGARVERVHARAIRERRGKRDGVTRDQKRLWGVGRLSD